MFGSQWQTSFGARAPSGSALPPRLPAHVRSARVVPGVRHRWRRLRRGERAVGYWGPGRLGGAGQRFSRGSAGGPETALCVFAPCCSCGGAGRGERQPRGVGGGRGKAWGASGASRSVQPGRPFREAAKSGRPAGARPAVQAVFPRGLPAGSLLSALPVLSCAGSCSAPEQPRVRSRGAPQSGDQRSSPSLRCLSSFEVLFCVFHLFVLT